MQEIENSQMAEMVDVEGMAEMTEAEMQTLMEEEQRKQSERLQAFGSRLQALAVDQVALKREIEERWLEDMRQYSGHYDEKTMAAIKDAKGSQAFVNISRAKTNTAEARLGDMLFPTDDRNWGIQPTPVPEMASAVGDQSPAMTEDGRPVVGPDGKAVPSNDVAQAVIQSAKKKADAMQLEMDDQLNEAQYNTKSREAIRDACILGTSIVKGPIVIGREKKSWKTLDDGVGGTIQVLQIAQDMRPSVERVDPWAFFPDMSALTLDDAEFVFQRHLMTRKALRGLAKQEGYLVDQVEEVLRQKEPVNAPTAAYVNEIRAINGVSAARNARFEVWEYHGPIDKDDLSAAGCECDDNPLTEVEGIIWFVDGRVIKAAINPMETEERPYSVYNWEKDDSSIFGFGIPYLMRNAQSAINGAWRMTLDNGGFSVAPQVVANPHIIKPADGNWNLSPKKLWLLTDRNRSVHEAFGAFEVNSHLGELQSILGTAKQLADEETNLPVIAQGEQGGATRTATGMSLLMNSANVVTRRSVKNWDDGITRTLLTRWYNWNMQNSTKEEIKGDYFVDARGSSALLAKETQAQNLIQMLQIAPTYGQLVKVPELLRKAVQSMQLDAVALVKTDQELQQEQAQAKQQPPSPEQQKIQAQIQIETMKAKVAQMEINARMEQVKSEREVALAGLALDKDMKISELRTKLGIEEMRISTKQDLFDKEAELKLVTGAGI
jgi:hypothetical protein